MDRRTGLGIGVLGAALLLGILGDWLLRSTPWGVNFLVWVVSLVGVAAAVAKLGRLRVAGEGRWLVPVAVLFAACVAWRDSATLLALNLLAFLIAVSLALLRGRTGRLRLAGVSEYVLAGIYAGALTTAGPIPVATREVEWRKVARGKLPAPALAVTRGVFLAAPLLVIFGALFIAADAVFQKIVLDLFGFDLAQVFGHISLTLAIAWITAGALWVALLGRERGTLALRRPNILSLGIVEIGTVLGLLDVLFLAFVVVQVRYLFGGEETVISTAGLTYAEYARRGFFELVTVTALALPTLLLAHWLLNTNSRGERAFRVLAGILVGLLFVVMASALQRMYLYVDEYGLTELRLYATIFMAWLAVLLAWLIVTVLRGRPDRFAFGALVTAFSAVLAVNAINPDALVAHTNLDRMEEGKRFDVHYLASLSADAVPVIVKAMPDMDERERRTVGNELHDSDRWSLDRTDWRTWNLSRSRARHLIENS